MFPIAEKTVQIVYGTALTVSEAVSDDQKFPNKSSVPPPCWICIHFSVILIHGPLFSAKTIVVAAS